MKRLLATTLVVILAGSVGHPSWQSAVPSPSVSVSVTPHPQEPGASLPGSFGQPSRQSAVPSPSLSVSGWPQPHWPDYCLRACKSG